MIAFLVNSIKYLGIVYMGFILVYLSANVILLLFDYINDLIKFITG